MAADIGMEPKPRIAEMMSAIRDFSPNIGGC